LDKNCETKLALVPNFDDSSFMFIYILLVDEKLPLKVLRLAIKQGLLQDYTVPVPVIALTDYGSAAHGTPLRGCQVPAARCSVAPLCQVLVRPCGPIANQGVEDGAPAQVWLRLVWLLY
jgi:hypothetical protein